MSYMSVKLLAVTNDQGGAPPPPHHGPHQGIVLLGVVAVVHLDANHQDHQAAPDQVWCNAPTKGAFSLCENTISILVLVYCLLSL